MEKRDRNIVTVKNYHNERFMGNMLNRNCPGQRSKDSELTLEKSIRRA